MHSQSLGLFLSLPEYSVFLISVGCGLGAQLHLGRLPQLCITVVANVNLCGSLLQLHATVDSTRLILVP